MFYTNGKILIEKQNNIDKLQEAVEKIIDHFEENKGVLFELEIDFELGYPSVAIPEEISYQDLNDVLMPFVQLRAINEDSMYIADKKVINERYVFTEEEKMEISTEISRMLKEANALEIEMKSSQARYKAKLTEVKNKINDKNDLFTNGFTYRDYTTSVKLNFADGKKYYVDIEDENIIRRIEKMEPSEKQLRLEHSLEPGVSTSENKDEKEEESFKEKIIGGTGTKEDPFVYGTDEEEEEGEEEVDEENLPM